MVCITSDVFIFLFCLFYITEIMLFFQLCYQSFFFPEQYIQLFFPVLSVTSVFKFSMSK